MAASDYRLCDVCTGKAFYDANLNYESGDKIAGVWVYPDEPFKTVGKKEAFDLTALERLGDWAVLCKACAKTYKTAIVPISKDAK